MARKRKKLSTSMRFEVFKRDSFKCQYCGSRAPEVVLEIDHIEPISKGGGDEILNLITSCWRCNSGKGDRALKDDAVIVRQHAQLAELQERREQLDMLLRWRDGNSDLAAREVTAFVERFDRATPGWVLNDEGIASARKLVGKHGLARSLDALDRAVAHKVKVVDGKATLETIDGLLGLVFVMAEPDNVQQLYRIRSRLRRVFNYVIDGLCISLLRRALESGATVGEIEARCDQWMRDKSSFRAWQYAMQEWISELSRGERDG